MELTCLAPTVMVMIMKIWLHSHIPHWTVQMCILVMQEVECLGIRPHQTAEIWWEPVDDGVLWQTRIRRLSSVQDWPPKMALQLPEQKTSLLWEVEEAVVQFWKITVWHLSHLQAQLLSNHIGAIATQSRSKKSTKGKAFKSARTRAAHVWSPGLCHVSVLFNAYDTCNHDTTITFLIECYLTVWLCNIAFTSVMGIIR